MKNTFLFTIISLLLLSTVYSQKNAEINWQQDLDYMKSYIEIIHPDSYAYVTEDEFSKDFNYIRDNCKTLDDTEIVMRIHELFVKIQDGHTGTNFTDKNNEYIIGLFRY